MDRGGWRTGKFAKYKGAKKFSGAVNHGAQYMKLDQSDRLEESSEDSDVDQVTEIPAKVEMQSSREPDQAGQRRSLKGEPKQMSMDLDGVFNYIGHCGFYQVGIGLMLCLLNTAPAYQALIMYFTSYNPPWQCSKMGIDECRFDGPVTAARFDYDMRCRMKRGSWEYAGPEITTFVTEFNLVCAKASKATLASSAFYLGCAIGSLPTGVISDMFGRKPVMFIATFSLLLSSFMSGYIQTIWQLTALRFITGFSMTGAGLNPYIILMEIVGPKFRPFASSAYFLWSSLSLVLLTLQAYIIRDWRTLFVVTSAPYALLFVFMIFVPESVRWLHLNGHAKQVADLLNKVADTNGKEVPPMILRAIHSENQGNFIDLFTPSKVFKRTAIQSFHWFVLGMTYFGISLASADLTGNMYRDFVLIVLAEVPCFFVVLKAANQYGRQRTVIWSLLGTALCCLVIALSSANSGSEVVPLMRIGSAVIGKFFISTAYSAYYIWSSELYPTVIRSQAMSLVALMSLLGATLAPVLTTVVNHINPSFPFAVMGLCCVVAASSGMLLSETKGRPTMETMEDLLQDEDYVELSGLSTFKTQRESEL